MRYRKVLKKHPHIIINLLISLPFLYGLIFPILVLDFFIELYHRICFPLYGIPYLKRTQYIKIDRQRLSYLSWFQKLNCMYCGYTNGIANYWKHMAAATEKFWCGIKHQKERGFNEPEHHKDFLPYNNKKALDKYLNE